MNNLIDDIFYREVVFGEGSNIEKTTRALRQICEKQILKCSEVFGHTVSEIKTKFDLKDIDLWLNYFDRI